MMSRQRCKRTGWWWARIIVLVMGVMGPLLLPMPMPVEAFPGISLRFLATTRTTRPMMVLSENAAFDPDLVRALDLGPNLQQVSAHCGTHRGRQALLRLVHLDQQQQRQNYYNKRDDFLEGGQKKRLLRQIDELIVQSSTRQRRVIASVAKSAQEARVKQEEGEQAMRLLRAGNFPSHLYPAESKGPTDLLANPIVTTDDDEWIHFSQPQQQTDQSNSDGDDLEQLQQFWTLEHILQAEQVVRKIVHVYDWAVSMESTTDADLLTAAAMEIPINRLRTVQNKIANTVQVVHVRSFLDPMATSSFRFRLNENTFSVLQILRTRERDLVQQQQQKPQSMTTTTYDKIARAIGDLRDEIQTKEKNIRLGLANIIYEVRCEIDDSLDILSQIDVAFAKAAFGLRMMEGTTLALKRGAISIPSSDPRLISKGAIRVKNFLHPLLHMPSTSNQTNVHVDVPVPIDLILGGCSKEDRVPIKALIISGPNGGGKTLAMKSFGLVCVLSKVGIPIPGNATIDFFDEILTVVGDQQNVERGESTFTAQLKRYSTFIDRIHLRPDSSFLVLMDELGGGTEENAGGAIGQAILEAMIATNNCRVVATTHSPRLKALSFHSQEIACAAVLLRNTNCNDIDSTRHGDHSFQNPSYILQYGCIGESRSMNAAERCNPPLPKTVLERAAELLDDTNRVNAEVTNSAPSTTRTSDNGSYMRGLTGSLERQLQLAEDAARVAQARENDSAMIQRAMVSLAAAYDNHLAKLEHRVEHCYLELQRMRKEGDNNPMLILGDTLAEMRLVRAQVKSEEDLLLEKGLKRMRDDYVPEIGDKVVVVDENSEWSGASGVVTSNELLSLSEGQRFFGDMVVVELSLWSGWSTIKTSSKDPLSVPILCDVQAFQRYQLALWDYESVWNDLDKSTRGNDKSMGIAGSMRRLSGLLSTLKPESTRKPSMPSSTHSLSPCFTSSRERKVAKQRKQKRKK